MPDDRFDLLHSVAPYPRPPALVQDAGERFRGMPQCSGWKWFCLLQEDVAFFAVLAVIQPLDFVVLVHPQADRSVDDL